MAKIKITADTKDAQNKIKQLSKDLENTRKKAEKPPFPALYAVSAEL